VNRTPDIYIEISDFFSEEYIASVGEDLRADKLELVVQTRRIQQYFTGAEWMVASSLSTYILKSYFESFLKEGGMDHYCFLKDWLRMNIETLKPIATKTIGTLGFQNKNNIQKTQSKVFSLHSIILDGVNLKFLFDNNLSIEHWQAASITALHLLEDYFLNQPNNELANMLSDVKPHANMLFAVINPTTMTWQLKSLHE
jgi:hypothetical protein